MKWRVRIFFIIAGLLLLAFFVEGWRRAHLESSQDRNILAASRKHGIDPALVKAVVWRESRFNSRASGGKGETGLMQIMEITGREWAEATRVSFPSKYVLLDPEKNIDCGTWYLRKLLGRYQRTDNPLPYALADYNAGRSNVLKWMKGSATTNSVEFIEQIGFPSTRAYVQAVMQRRVKYLGEFPSDSRQ